MLFIKMCSIIKMGQGLQSTYSSLAHYTVTLKFELNFGDLRSNSTQSLTRNGTKFVQDQGKN